VCVCVCVCVCGVCVVCVSVCLSNKTKKPLGFTKFEIFTTNLVRIL